MRLYLIRANYPKPFWIIRALEFWRIFNVAWVYRFQQLVKGYGVRESLNIESLEFHLRKHLIFGTFFLRNTSWSADNRIFTFPRTLNVLVDLVSCDCWVVEFGSSIAVRHAMILNQKKKKKKPLLGLDLTLDFGDMLVLHQKIKF